MCINNLYHGVKIHLDYIVTTLHESQYLWFSTTQSLPPQFIKNPEYQGSKAVRTLKGTSVQVSCNQTYFTQALND